MRPLSFAAAVLLSAIASAQQSVTFKASDYAENCPLCIFQGFAHCGGGPTDSCVMKDADCPAGTNKMVAMSACNAKYFTAAANSNCGTTTTMGAQAL